MSIDFPKEEEAVLKRWKEIKAFERQVELSRGRKPFTFYDGPPFATGLPHYGHLLASTIKDIIPRYWSMKGHYVERRFGWDTHGLPIEYEIDKKLGLSGKDAVMEMGLSKYNAECRAIGGRPLTGWGGGLTSTMTTRHGHFESRMVVDTVLISKGRRWTQHSWSQYGGFSSSFMKRTLSIEVTESCHTRQPSILL